MTKTWRWPQWVFLALYVGSTLILAKHHATAWATDKKTAQQAAANLLADFMGNATIVFIVWRGGFWR